MKAIMVVGTTSHAGKSLITTAICRLLAQQGKRVTPFKGQNMALNAYVTATGGEIGHAQAVQAWAAKVEPRVEMNPILLKPQGDMTSQVVIKGAVVGKVGAADYYKTYFDRGWQAITESLTALAEDFDWVVCEGAGSPAEINLKHRDLTNMRVASHLQAATILVVDIDRGGAFAHVVGTLALLEPEERALIKGIVINKFRGQRSLLDSGISWLEEYTGIPVMAVIPWMEQVFPAEDSLDLLERRSGKKHGADLSISVLRLPRIANFTDFDPLESEPSVHLQYLQPQDSLDHPDALIIPGSKTTIPDLLTLEKTGLAAAIKEYAAAGGTIFGICGGLQMLGTSIADPYGLEGIAGTYPGLGLLPLTTILTQQKITTRRSCTSRYPQEGFPITGYEIHQGTTTINPSMNFRSRFDPHPSSEPNLNSELDPNSPSYYPLFDDPSLGIIRHDLTIGGTYLHGVFDNGAWRRVWLNHLRSRRGLGSLPTGIASYQEQREVMLDLLAENIAQHLDLTPLLN